MFLMYKSNTFTVVLVTASVAIFGCPVDAWKTYLCGDDEFVLFCESRMKGVVINNRCFFSTEEKAAFDQGWSICGTYNATVAQLHTSAEFSAVASYISKKGGTYAYVALRRDTVASGNSEFLYTYWYSGPTEKIQALSSAVTYAREHQIPNSDAGNEYCYITWKNPSQLNDWGCATPETILCQITNIWQTFKFIPGVCIQNQGLIAELPNLTVDECGDACRTSLPCRSFNFFANNTCQLTTWSVDDLDSDKASVDGCYHYS